VSYVTAIDKDGNTIQLRGDLTLEDLMRMGFEVRLQAKPPVRPTMVLPLRREEIAELKPVLKTRTMEERISDYCGFKVVSKSPFIHHVALFTTGKFGQSIVPVIIPANMTNVALKAKLPEIKKKLVEAIRMSDAIYELKHRKRGPYSTKKNPKKPAPKSSKDRKK